MYEIKTQDVSEIFIMDNFSNYLAKSKYYDDSNKLVVDKMKDETASDAIEEFVRLKPKMYVFLVDSD